MKEQVIQGIVLLYYIQETYELEEDWFTDMDEKFLKDFKPFPPGLHLKYVIFRVFHFSGPMAEGKTNKFHEKAVYVSMSKKKAEAMLKFFNISRGEKSFSFDDATLCYSSSRMVH